MFSSGSGASGGRFSERMAELAPTLNAETDQGEFFLPSSHVQILEKLDHLSRYSNFIQIVLGASGSGKSTLLKQFYPADDDSSVQACFIQAQHDTSLTSLLDSLTEQLDIELPVSAGDEDKLQAIYQQADMLQDISRLFLIVVDDADRLDDDCLDLLVNLLNSVKNPDAKPHLVMFALPKLAERMNASQKFKTTVDSSCHFVELMPMDQEELESYLQHSFTAESQLLSVQQLQRLHAESFGLPGRVGKVIEKVLSNRASSSKKSTGNGWLSFPRLHLISIAVLGAAVTSWMLMPYSSDESGDDRVRVQLPVPSIQETPESTTPLKESEQTIEQRLLEADAKLKAESLAANEAKPLKPKPLQPSAEKVEPEDTSIDESRSDIRQEREQLAVAPVKQATTPAIENEPVKVTKDNPKKLVLKLPATTEKPKSVITPSTTETIIKAQAPQAEVKKVVKAKPKSPYLREQELLSWDPKGYTLQMLGARKELSVIQFIRSRTDKDNFYYFSTIYKGKPWYVIVYGNYPNRDTAISAVSKLPADLRRKKPWPRSVKGVQDDIRRKK